jgi:hypothetical protein
MTDPQANTATTTIEKPRSPALNILNELSTGTYVSYSRALKELLSNAWDAGAHDVQIKIASDLSETTILDDRHVRKGHPRTFSQDRRLQLITRDYAQRSKTYRAQGNWSSLGNPDLP